MQHVDSPLVLHLPACVFQVQHVDAGVAVDHTDEHVSGVAGRRCDR